jgi:hypothetical protein
LADLQALQKQHGSINKNKCLRKSFQALWMSNVSGLSFFFAGIGQITAIALFNLGNLLLI